MRSLCSSKCRTLRLTLTASVYFMLELSTCTAGKCGLQTTEKMTFGSITIRNTGMKLCQVRSPRRHSRRFRREDVKLLKACKYGTLDNVRQIVSRDRANINYRGPLGLTPLMNAAQRKGMQDMIEFLVRIGANASVIDANGDTILHHACVGADEETVKYFISQDIVDINCRGYHGRTPVMNAAEAGSVEVVKLLVSEGADLSLVDTEGSTILHGVCRRGHSEVASYILTQNRIDINARDMAGRTPLDLAKTPRRHSRRFRREDVKLLKACKYGTLDNVRQIVSRDRANINYRGPLGLTPLMNAAQRKGMQDMIEFLVRIGANASVIDANGDTILHHACVGADEETVKYFISQDIVDINCRGYHGRTPVMNAAEAGSVEVVKLLVSEGADLSLVDTEGSTILHGVCRRGHSEVASYILTQNRIDINARDMAGRTPLDLAKSKDMHDLLVSHGAHHM
ncbi:ankyrin repeat, PH and SEC7 domain containing protein secG-like [Haliotis rufescens]|uniref:ankyrin repeat, PH and SEC7 domain containing protein secG-like n=1 Tax=Haliotis rufescens TaxID=6454 RepID=UPI00201E87A2|nr:ankyrin repeat, PH and SEC7 domain containing protein secG-like [Haliotis rufescens]